MKAGIRFIIVSLMVSLLGCGGEKSKPLETLLCGNGKVDDGEDCDDGPNNGAPGSPCRSDCTFAVPEDKDFCGDGKVSGSEVCDDGDNNGKYGFCKSDCSGKGPHCGDGIKNGSETCDDGKNNGQYGYCKSNCSGKGPYCGDGIKNGSEICDDGANNGQEGYCHADCLSYCGDGNTDPGEICDEGEDNGFVEHCNAFCSGYVEPRCGDGIINGVEVCDDGDGHNDGYFGHCKPDCSGIEQLCGNGSIDNGEQCDGNSGVSPTCGNGGMSYCNRNCQLKCFDSPTCSLDWTAAVINPGDGTIYPKRNAGSDPNLAMLTYKLDVNSGNILFRVNTWSGLTNSDPVYNITVLLYYDHRGIGLVRNKGNAEFHQLLDEAREIWGLVDNPPSSFTASVNESKQELIFTLSLTDLYRYLPAVETGEPKNSLHIKALVYKKNVNNDGWDLIDSIPYRKITWADRLGCFFSPESNPTDPANRKLIAHHFRVYEFEDRDWIEGVLTLSAPPSFSNNDSLGFLLYNTNEQSGLNFYIENSNVWIGCFNGLPLPAIVGHNWFVHQVTIDSLCRTWHDVTQTPYVLWGCAIADMLIAVKDKVNKTEWPNWNNCKFQYTKGHTYRVSSYKWNPQKNDHDRLPKESNLSNAATFDLLHVK